MKHRPNRVVHVTRLTYYASSHWHVSRQSFRINRALEANMRPEETKAVATAMYNIHQTKDRVQENHSTRKDDRNDKG
jgi:hypothetical protein